MSVGSCDGCKYIDVMANEEPCRSCMRIEVHRIDRYTPKEDVDCNGCRHIDRIEHEYPCCICTRLDAVRRDQYEPKEEG